MERNEAAHAWLLGKKLVLRLFRSVLLRPEGFSEADWGRLKLSERHPEFQPEFQSGKPGQPCCSSMNRNIFSPASSTEKRRMPSSEMHTIPASMSA
jgi:hypothetical protein